jgi:hypothetical protein
VFTGDRWDAVRKLAQSIGVTVNNDEYGRFIIAPADLPPTPKATIRGGQLGTLITQSAAITRVDQYNAVGLTSEPPVGDNLFVYVVDNDPQSPTYYEGPFGRKPTLIRNDMVTTLQAAIDAARVILAKKRTAARNLTIDAVFNPLLQPLDTVTVYPLESGDAELHVIESINMPLLGGQMQIKTHLWTRPPDVVRAVVNGTEVDARGL